MHWSEVSGIFWSGWCVHMATDRAFDGLYGQAALLVASAIICSILPLMNWWTKE